LASSPFLFELQRRISFPEESLNKVNEETFITIEKQRMISSSAKPHSSSSKDEMTRTEKSQDVHLESREPLSSSRFLQSLSPFPPHDFSVLKAEKASLSKLKRIFSSLT
jgi:hypothetical protein